MELAAALIAIAECGKRIGRIVADGVNSRSAIRCREGWEAHQEERWFEAPEAVSSTLTPTILFNAKWCNWQHARL